MDFWTLESMENAGFKDVIVEDRQVRIKSIDPKLLVLLFADAGVKEGDEMSKEDLLKNLELMDEVLVNGLVLPVVTKETVDKLGRFKKPIVAEILEFSGLSEKANAKVEAFREESVGGNG